MPEARGLDAAGILEAAANGRIDTLVLLGADPLADFPDLELATRALAGARTVIATDLFLTASTAQADIVLPAAGFAECGGTTTNIEGRISRLGQVVTPPGHGSHRLDDRRRAGAAPRSRPRSGVGRGHLEGDREHRPVARRHHAGSAQRHPKVQTGWWLRSTRDGLPRSTSVRAAGRHVRSRRAIPTGSIPTTDRYPSRRPGSAHADAAAADTAAQAADEPEEAQAYDAAAQEHTAEATAEGDKHPAEPGHRRTPTAGADRAGAGRLRRGAPPGRPALLRFVSPADLSPPPPIDAYSLRLIADRKLYDRGTLVQHAPSMAGFAPAQPLRVNPYELDRLGLADGVTMSVTSAAGRRSLMTVVGDAAVPRGSAWLLFNEGDPSPAVLIDATAAVTDVRVETTS